MTRAVMAMALPAALALAIVPMHAARAQVQPTVEDLLMRVGDRVAEFYERAKSVICVETSTVQPLDISNSPAGFMRTVESELHVEIHRGEIPGEASLVRKVR